MTDDIKNQFNQSILNNPVFNDSKREIPKILSATLPFLPPFFLGREPDLKAVHEKLFSGENLLLLVNGEGGIGKTTFAAKYWREYENEYSHLAWVFTGNNLLDALLTLAPRLQLSFPETMPSEQRLTEMLAVMAGLKKPCLLVLDNANDADEIGKYYQDLNACANFHILLTTRITSFEEAATYPIPPLDEEHALALFKKHYPGHRDNDDELLKAIRIAVGGNTLVLELLAKNLAALNSDEVFYPLAGLLRDLQQKGLFRLAQEKTIKVACKQNRHGFIETRPTDVLAALYDEVEMVKPLNDEEKQLLSNLAMLPAENIAYAQLKVLLAPENAQAFSNTLSNLAERGWLEKSRPVTGGTQYKISPVVQEITRHKNRPQLLEHVRTLISSLIDKLAYEPGTGHFMNAGYEEAAMYAGYAATVISHVATADGNLAVLCNRIGSFHNTTGNLNQALSFFEECSRFEKELYKAYPDNVSFKNGLAVSYEKLGETHTALGHLDRALGFFEDRSRLGKELYESYPDNASFKSGLAVSYSKLGETHTALGHLDQALEFFEDETGLFEELYEAYPDNVSFKNGLAVSYERLGDTHTALGHLERALEFFEDETGLFKELYESYPDNVSFKNGLAISYSKLGETHTALGHLDRALGFFENDLQLTKELYEAYPDNVSFKNGLAVSYSKLGVTHAALGNLDKALGFFEDCSRLCKELYEAYPDNVSFKNGLAVSYSQLGRFYRDQKSDKAMAKLNFEQCYRLWRELAVAYPAYVAFKNNLAWAKNALEGL